MGNISDRGTAPDPRGIKLKKLSKRWNFQWRNKFLSSFATVRIFKLKDYIIYYLNAPLLEKHKGSDKKKLKTSPSKL